MFKRAGVCISSVIYEGFLLVSALFVRFGWIFFLISRIVQEYATLILVQFGKEKEGKLGVFYLLSRDSGSEPPNSPPDMWAGTNFDILGNLELANAKKPLPGSILLFLIRLVQPRVQPFFKYLLPIHPENKTLARIGCNLECSTCEPFAIFR